MSVKKTISSFSSKFSGGVRPNLFVCNINPPGGISVGTDDFSFHCKGTSIPASSVPAIDVNYLGRQLKVPGDRTYADWTVTVYNDVDMSIRHAFEVWMHQIQNHGENVQVLGEPYGKGTVTQMSRRGDPISSYFIEVLPTEISAIDLAWDSNDAVEEYTVNFAVNYWIPKAKVGFNATYADGDELTWHITGNGKGVTGGGFEAKKGNTKVKVDVGTPS